MKGITNKTLRSLAIGWLTATLSLSASGQGTAFSYQGRLHDGANPASGIYDLRFAIYDAASAGTQQGSTMTNAATAVTNGLFTTTLDFGNQFPGADRWLEIGVRTNGVGAFTTLGARHKLTPAPYAMFAARANAAGLLGSVPAASVAPGTITGAMIANGTVTADKLATGAVGAAQIADGSIATNDLSAAVLNQTFWRLSGNAGANPTNGAFIGSTDNLPVEFRVNNQRALRLVYATNSLWGAVPHVVGGHPANVVSNGFVGAVISGGGDESSPHRAGEDFTTIVGGRGNTASGRVSTAMGGGTTASGFISTAMGSGTTASGSYSTAMGDDTTASSTYSTALGTQTTASGIASTAIGYLTRASGSYSTTMGSSTLAAGDYSLAAGRRAKANHEGAFVWADSQSVDFASIATDEFAIRAGGGVRMEGGTDAEPGSGGILTLGSTSGANLVLDNNEIMARNNGVVATLSLNFDGGGVRTGGSLGVARAPAANSLEVEGSASKTVSGSWFANSDARIKQEVQPVTSALDTLGKVRLVSFRYTDNYLAEHRTLEDRRYLNVIAQEFAQVFPEHVKSSGEKLPDGSDILQVDTHPLTIYSAAAIQELSRKLEQKESEITDLKTRLANLEQLVNHKLNGGAQ